MSRRRRSAAGAPEGGLVVDKPPGVTSHDVVAVARRAFGQPRIGHTGTLDPMATGVLVLLLGRATRLAQYLAASRKTYLAQVRFGFATDSYDADGTPTVAAGLPAPHEASKDRHIPGPGGRPRDTQVDSAALERALDAFRGRHLQTPPPVSAKRVGGRRAYDLAREDRAVPLEPVAVEVFDLRLLEVGGDTATLTVTCSAGFYVRALAHGLGEHLGTGAHLSALRRERAGDFHVADAIPLERLAETPASAAQSVVPMASLLPGLSAATLTDSGRLRLKHGQPVRGEDLASAGAGWPQFTDRVRLLDRDGTLLGLAVPGPAALHPVVVLM
jgi:tRNA pseudouridine55 synthase